MLERITYSQHTNKFGEEYAFIELDGRSVAWIFQDSTGSLYINGLGRIATRLPEELQP